MAVLCWREMTVSRCGLFLHRFQPCLLRKTDFLHNNDPHWISDHLLWSTQTKQKSHFTQMKAVTLKASELGSFLTRCSSTVCISLNCWHRFIVKWWMKAIYPFIIFVLFESKGFDCFCHLSSTIICLILINLEQTVKWHSGSMGKIKEVRGSAARVWNDMFLFPAHTSAPDQCLYCIERARKSKIVTFWYFWYYFQQKSTNWATF